jgi:RNA polymerase sigma-70 factor, ECF subfamily
LIEGRRRPAPSEQRKGLDVDERLWALTRRRLLSFIATRVESGVDAEDVVQDVLVKMARGLDSLDQADRIEAWAYRIARNAIADEYRRRGRHDAALAHLSGFVNDATSDLAADTVVEADLVELSECLRPLVDQLPPAYRDALAGTDLAGVTQAEAAALAGLSLSGMKSRVQRGRRQLAQLLEQCCEIDASDARIRGRPHGGKCSPTLPPPAGCNSAATPERVSRRG